MHGFPCVQPLILNNYSPATFDYQMVFCWLRPLYFVMIPRYAGEKTRSSSLGSVGPLTSKYLTIDIFVISCYILTCGCLVHHGYNVSCGEKQCHKPRIWFRFVAPPIKIVIWGIVYYCFTHINYNCW